MEKKIRLRGSSRQVAIVYFVQQACIHMHVKLKIAMLLPDHQQPVVGVFRVLCVVRAVTDKLYRGTCEALQRRLWLCRK